MLGAVRTGIVVAISSVPWREANLVALLDDLRRQTVQPDVVLLTLDGYTRVPDAVVAATLVNEPPIDLQVHPTPCGPGTRWRRLEALTQGSDLSLGVNALVIDDDFRLDEQYIAITDANQSLCGGAIAWSGARADDGDHTSWTDPTARELLAISAGCCAMPLAWLHNVTDYPDINDYFGVGGDDEALVSYHIWLKEGAQWCALRPEGPAPLRSVDALANDPRAAGEQYGFARIKQRLRLRDELGWDIYKLPPSLRGREEEWRKKPWEK